MNANEVLNELGKYGAVADAEWHGDKLEMKTHEQRAEEWAASEEHQDGEDEEEESIKVAEPGRFEIEVEDSKPKGQTSFNGLDALQLKRGTPNAVF